MNSDWLPNFAAISPGMTLEIWISRLDVLYMLRPHEERVEGIVTYLAAAPSSFPNLTLIEHRARTQENNDRKLAFPWELFLLTSSLSSPLFMHYCVHISVRAWCCQREPLNLLYTSEILIHERQGNNSAIKKIIRHVITMNCLATWKLIAVFLAKLDFIFLPSNLIKAHCILESIINY